VARIFGTNLFIFKVRKMTDATKTQSVVEKLKAQKELRKDKTGSIELPISGVTVTYPLFIMHSEVKKANRIAKGKSDEERAINAQTLLIVNICKFDGEKLTAAEFSDLLDMTDISALMEAVNMERTEEDLGDLDNPKS